MKIPRVIDSVGNKKKNPILPIRFSLLLGSGKHKILK